SGTAKHFDTLLDTLNQKYDFQMVKKASGFGPSDHASFYSKQIPVIMYWTGTHPDYHRPSDTADKISIPGMRKIIDLAEDTIAHLATRTERPEYVSIAAPKTGGGPSGPRIGIRPAYDDDKEGVLLEGVNDGGPAHKAGLKAGDRIVEVGGKPARNLESYMVLMSSQKRGEPIELTIQRGGEKIKVQVKP